MRYVAIVDYGLGNLFSVKHACEHAGISAHITSEPADVQKADGVILPGVGAFGEAMLSLKKIRMVDAIREAVNTGKPFLGICLGMQLLMTESFEFGRHEGLGILAGTARPLKKALVGEASLKVPHIGWASIRPGSEWKSSLLQGLKPGVAMYFVHSYYCELSDPSQVLSWTEFGSNKFCSGLRKDNIEAVQFHPERSGNLGLNIYENFAKKIKSRR